MPVSFMSAEIIALWNRPVKRAKKYKAERIKTACSGRVDLRGVSVEVGDGPGSVAAADGMRVHFTKPGCFNGFSLRILAFAKQ